MVIGQNQKALDLDGAPTPRGLLEGHGKKTLIVLSPGHLSDIGN